MLNNFAVKYSQSNLYENDFKHAKIVIKSLFGFVNLRYSI